MGERKLVEDPCPDMSCIFRLGGCGTAHIWLDGGCKGQIVRASESMGLTHVLRDAEGKHLMFSQQSPALCIEWR
jgi:hypothetical protein